MLLHANNHMPLWVLVVIGGFLCVDGIQFQRELGHLHLDSTSTTPILHNNDTDNNGDYIVGITSGISDVISAAAAAEEEARATSSSGGRTQGLMVGLSLIPFAASKGAVCLDGTLPGYHLHRGSGSGANKWLVHLEGGGWCNNRRTCVFRKTTRHGSSKYMEKALLFTGILSNKKEENPDFYNWNRVKVRYCDGASFSGEGYDPTSGLFFRGHRIWIAAMEELMSKGMSSAKQALLSGCSAGGLSSILHCDDFRRLFRPSTKVKCLGDAGLFLDIVDIAGARALRKFFNGVVTMQGVGPGLPKSCTNHMDKTSCFFPQNLLKNIQTPLFILNSAYDLWQIYEGIAPRSADVHGSWMRCKKSHASCSSSQLSVLQDFRNQMVRVIKGFRSSKNGLFINSCFAHCQSELQDTWFSRNSPRLGNKRIAEAVGDWYFDRTRVRSVDCPYPCDRTCRNLN